MAPLLPSSFPLLLPISSSLLRRGDRSTAVTHVECICHRTKKQSVQPSFPIPRHISSRCHRYKEGRDQGSCLPPPQTLDNRYSFALAFHFQLLRSAEQEEEKGRSGREAENAVFKALLQSRTVNLSSSEQNILVNSNFNIGKFNKNQINYSSSRYHESVVF